MTVELTLCELYRAERVLCAALTATAERHRAEPEVHHVAHDLAGWSREHVHDLSATARRYDLRLPDRMRRAGVLSGLRKAMSVLLGRRPEVGLVLLADLRHLHRTAAGVSVDWELLGQAAQATKDADLLALAQRCHPQTLRQLRWANGMLKTLAPQILTG
jgi:hypothetical protein